MATPVEIAAAHYRAQQAIVRQGALAAAAVWRSVEYSNLDSSWDGISGNAVRLLALGQYAAASQASGYIERQAAAQDVELDRAVLVDARGFSGTAADGRALSTLLRGGIVETKVSIAAGLPPRESMLRGLATLTLAWTNETAQAGRNADHVALTGQTTMHGYVRVLSGTSCSRCVVLAGKFYRWNNGFQRHPHCDCIHLPADVPADVAGADISPRAHFDSLSRADQDAVFGKVNAAAIRDGADMSQVVNATRGMDSYGVTTTRVNADGRVVNASRRTFTGTTTREGASVQRGRYGRSMADSTGQLDRRQRAQNGRSGGYDPFAPRARRYAGIGMHELADVARLTPRAIYDLAGADRSLAVELLRRYGYLT